MNMLDVSAVTLPCGLWLDGVCHREAELRPLSGNDEAFLLETAESLSLAHRTTAILVRCLTHLEPLDEVTKEAVGQLTVGDREALLLHLRRLTLGERLQCVLGCPESDCGEPMDLDLLVSDLLLSPYTNSREWYETSVFDNGMEFKARFRLPRVIDIEAVASLAKTNPEAVAEMLLHRCVERVKVVGDDEDKAEEWPPALARQISSQMAELDPQAELNLNLKCPTCGHDFSAILDVASFFFQEISGRMDRLYKEVHWIAYYYHWSEAEIMGMSAKKRLIYLNLLADALSEEGAL